MNLQRNIVKLFLVCAFLVMNSYCAIGQDSLTESVYAHRGLKTGLSLGATNPTSQKELDGGGGGMISLGYGFTEDISVWAAVSWADLSDDGIIDTEPVLAGLELFFKYSFLPSSRIQPFGRIGIGGYELEEDKTDNALSGYGFNLTVGADYFFSRHFGFGVEMHYKNITYVEERIGKNGNFNDLQNHIDGNVVGGVATFVMQL